VLRKVVPYTADQAAMRDLFCLSRIWNIGPFGLA